MVGSSLMGIGSQRSVPSRWVRSGPPYSPICAIFAGLEAPVLGECAKAHLSEPVYGDRATHTETFSGQCRER